MLVRFLQVRRLRRRIPLLGIDGVHVPAAGRATLRNSSAPSHSQSLARV